MGTSVMNVLRRKLPETFHKLENKLMIPYMRTLIAKASQEQKDGDKPHRVPWLKFDGLVVGRNSLFHTDRLFNAQLEEIGGVEYRALSLLSYLVAFVSFA